MAVIDEAGDASALSIADVAFLSQDDSFFAQLSVEEILETEERLQFHDESPERVATKRRELTSALGLSKVLKRKVGDRRAGAKNSHSGLSGGERRRLSVAVEMLGDVKVILADEPTTGLDASQAHKVVRKISEIAKQRGVPCCMTLHAPRGSVYDLLDDVFLLGPGGKPIYLGPASKACAYFAKRGFKCPSNTNIAEFLIDLVSVDTEDEEQAQRDLDRIDSLAFAFRKSDDAKEYSPDTKLVRASPRPRLPVLRRIGVLIRRSFKQNARDLYVNVLRLGACGILASVFSSIFGKSLQGPPSAKGVADRTALLSYSVINMAMMALMKTLDLFGKEKPVVTRERMRSHYTGTEYLIAKLIAEVPMDCSFAVFFSVLLKRFVPLNITMKRLAATLAMTTIVTDLLGFAVGSIMPDAGESVRECDRRECLCCCWF